MILWIIFSGLAIALFTLLPLSFKWDLDRRITLPAIFIIGIVSGIIVERISCHGDLTIYNILLLELFLIATISISLILWRFYRDPERKSPKDKNTILSPADGKIIYIKKIEEGQIPLSEKNGRKFSLFDFVQQEDFPDSGYLVGIEMTYLDVHVNRAPISGRITLIRRIKGRFISLKKKEAVIQNERVLITMNDEKFKLGIVLIASRLVRRIVPYIQVGQEVQIGERIGMIRFGSQVDLILPNRPSFRIQVSLGEKVKAGISIIATFKKAKE